MPRKRLSLNHLVSVARRELSQTFEPDLIDPILAEAEADNPAAEFIVAGALERGGELKEARNWYQRAAELGYRPALERLRRLQPAA